MDQRHPRSRLVVSCVRVQRPIQQRITSSKRPISRYFDGETRTRTGRGPVHRICCVPCVPIVPAQGSVVQSRRRGWYHRWYSRPLECSPASPRPTTVEGGLRWVLCGFARGKSRRVGSCCQLGSIGPSLLSAWLSPSRITHDAGRSGALTVAATRRSPARASRRRSARRRATVRSGPASTARPPARRLPGRLVPRPHPRSAR